MLAVISELKSTGVIFIFDFNLKITFQSLEKSV
jgi:hypothetical protein